MAIIDLVTWNEHLVTPQDDALVYESAVSGSGIIHGAEITIKNGSMLHITGGHGIVCGRKFTIEEGDIPIVLSSGGNLQGRLYVHLDLSNASAPIELLTETGSSLTPVVQQQDVNINFGIYEFNLCTFTVGDMDISGLVNVTPMVTPNRTMFANAQEATQAAQTTANTAVTNAATAQTTANAARNADNNTATITLPVASWALSGTTYRQSVTIPKTSVYTQNPVFDLHVTTPPPTDTQLADYGYITYVGSADSGNNYVFTFYASETPSAAITLSASGISGTYTGG